MYKSKRITERDYRSLLQLAGEMGEIADGQARRKYLLGRLADMLGASCGVICRTGWRNGRYQLFEYQMEDQGRMTPEFRSAYFAGEIPVDPMGPIMDQQKSGHATLRAQAISDRAWYRSEHYNNYRTQLKLDDAVYGKVITRAGYDFGFTFARDVNDARMQERHRDILRLCCQTVASLLELDRWPCSGALESLSPQLRAIAQGYMEGMSAKQVARKLGLTESTVREYTKIMHRRLNVSSRGELLALLFRNS